MKLLAAAPWLEHTALGPTATHFLQVQRHLCGEDLEGSEGATATPSHKQSQRVEGERRGGVCSPGSRPSSAQVLTLSIYGGENEARQPVFPMGLGLQGSRVLNSQRSQGGGVQWGKPSTQHMLLPL